MRWGVAAAVSLRLLATGCAAAEEPAPAGQQLDVYLQEPVRAAVADRGAGYLGPVFVGAQGVAGEATFNVRVERFVPPVTSINRRGLAGPLGAFPETELALPVREGPLGLRLELAELEGSEVLLLRMVVTNPGADPLRLTRVTLLGIDPARGGVWTSGLQQENALVLGGAPDMIPGDQGRLSPATAACRSSWYQLIYERSTGRSALVGMLTVDRALSEMRYEPDPSGRGIAGLQVDLLLRPFLQLEPGGEYRTETLYVDRSRLDASKKLHRFLASMAAYQRIVPPAEKVAVGWDPWRGCAGALDEAHFTVQLTRMAELLGAYGLNRCLIGPGWAERPGAWMPAASRFSCDLSGLVARIRGSGFEPGVWWTPFAASRDAPIAEEHPDWMLQLDALGRSLQGLGSAHVLDPANPDALAWVGGEADRLLASGAAWLVEDGIEAALFGEHYAARGRTAIEVVRDALARLRDAGGRGVTGLAHGSGGFLAGRARSVRLGPPLVTKWDRDPERVAITSATADVPDRGGASSPDGGSVLDAIGGLAHRLAAENLLWQNHAGTFVLGGLAPGEARAVLTALALSGASFDVGDLPEGMNADLVDTLRTTLPPVAGAANVLDLLDHDPPWIWHRSVRSPIGDWALVGLFHWGTTGDGRESDARLRRIAVPLPLLGLPVGTGFSYHAYEFWSGEYLGAITEHVEADVPPRSVRLVKIVRTVPRPDLVASSRHWTMGAIDLAKISWNPDSGVLFGRQELLAGRPVRLTFVLPAGWEVRRFHLNGVDQRWRARDAAIEVDLTPGSGGSQFWELVTTKP